MKKTKKTYLVTALVALALAGGQSAYAKTSSGDENSVYNWGPWDKMVSPAAGPSGVDVDRLAFNVPEDYEPEKNPTREDACPDRLFTGYGSLSASFWSDSYQSDPYSRDYDGGETSRFPVMINVLLNHGADWTSADWYPDQDKFPGNGILFDEFFGFVDDEVGMDGAELYSSKRIFTRNDNPYNHRLSELSEYNDGPWSDNYDANGWTDYYFEYDDEGNLVYLDQYDGGEGGSSAPFNSLIGINFEIEGETYDTGTMPIHCPSCEIDPPWKSDSSGDYSGGQYVMVDGEERYRSWDEGYWVEIDLRPVLAEDSGIYRVWYGEYAGIEESGSYDGGEGTVYWSEEEDVSVRGLFLVGVPSTVGQVVARGNAVAHYSGEYFSNHWRDGSDVHITVDFGDDSWSGQWNGGYDGSTYTQSTIDGKTSLGGEVGFYVNDGTINGATFAAEGQNIGAYDGEIISGNIGGTFIGSGASSMIGNADIVKTRPDYYENANHVSTFGAVEVEYDVQPE